MDYGNYALLDVSSVWFHTLDNEAQLWTLLQMEGRDEGEICVSLYDPDARYYAGDQSGVGAAVLLEGTCRALFPTDVYSSKGKDGKRETVDPDPKYPLPYTEGWLPMHTARIEAVCFYAEYKPSPVLLARLSQLGIPVTYRHWGDRQGSVFP